MTTASMSVRAPQFFIIHLLPFIIQSRQRNAGIPESLFCLLQGCCIVLANSTHINIFMQQCGSQTLLHPLANKATRTREPGDATNHDGE